MRLINSISNRLWRCCSGQVVSFELVLVGVVLLLGLVVGAGALRDAVVSELNDTGLSVQNANQSVNYSGASGGSSSTAGSGFADMLDVSDGQDVVGASVGLDFSVGPTNEEAYDLASYIETGSYEFKMSRGSGFWTGSAGFSGGTYSASPYWPGVYSIVGDTITVVLDSIGSNWQDGTIVVDATDPDNMTGTVSWVSTFSGFVWEAIYQICRQ